MGRRIVAVAFASALLGAGLIPDGGRHDALASPQPPSTAQTVSATTSTRILRKPSDRKTGDLEHPARLASFFARLEEIEAHRASSDVRIVQLGDSHTASDYGTSIARARLAARFGDGGRGFIPMGQPYRRLFQAGETLARGVGFEPDGAPLLGTSITSEGFFGLSGNAMVTRSFGAIMTSELSASADRFEIAYLARPGGGSFDVTIDGQSRGRVSTREPIAASAFRTFATTRGAHVLEVRAVGDGQVRVFGVRLDDTAMGVTLDSLGINGARATTPLAIPEAHFAEQLAHAAPALAIVAYGTNEAGDSVTKPDEHASAIRALVARIKKAAPGSACVVLGPPDRDARMYGRAQTLSKLGEVIAAQRSAADDAGCAFFDQFTAMGAAGSIGRWSSESPPRARRDLVHLTRAGYAFLAEALVRDVVTSYEGWKGESAVVARGGTPASSEATASP